ncbi:hypothetical protein F2Q70_00022185 [Brassica cretica]|uniref:RNase H type-1 domain-containing protein n=2 Tax=Brassica cretica TaxID=69181 RepID=A0A8S9HQT5_BRACR|nr:hypothetical protein F2Q70_00022185 [Brassica cretica]KAF2559042.1 hypothetical protein F2Q68_00016059 [Brassica cretica]KAF3608381.1 hypothetical protein DY000_02048593 [Brassica cretica]
MAKALAIRIALLHAASCNYTHIWLRSDSQGLVRTITQRRRTVELYDVLSDIDLLAFSTDSPFISRHFNGQLITC